MTIAEDFLLFVTEPETGVCQLGSARSNATLGGAILLDLVYAERVELKGSGRHAKAVLTDREPLGDPELDAAIVTLQTRGPLPPQSAVRALGRKMRAPLYAALEADGAVRSEPHRIWGLWPSSRHPVTDFGRRNTLRHAIQNCLLAGQPADGATGPIISLLGAAEMLKIAVEQPDLRLARARAKEVSVDDWPCEGVRKATRSTNAALLDAVISSTKRARPAKSG